MNEFNQNIIYELDRVGLVPLFTFEDLNVGKHVVDIAYEAGIRVFEMTNRRPNSFELFCQLKTYCEALPGFHLGIGTVMDGETTRKFLDAGADFIISPVMKPEMGKVCNAFEKLWIPGCATLTEIVGAKDHGAKVIKIFPGSVLGPQFVSSILPVVPDLKLMITGGVSPTEENLRSWFQAGAMCVGMGSQLFTKNMMDTQNWTSLKEQISNTITLIQFIRKK